MKNKGSLKSIFTDIANEIASKTAELFLDDNDSDREATVDNLAGNIEGVLEYVRATGDGSERAARLIAGIISEKFVLDNIDIRNDMETFRDIKDCLAVDIEQYLEAAEHEVMEARQGRDQSRRSESSIHMGSQTLSSPGPKI